MAAAPPTLPLARDLAGTPVLITVPVTDNVLHSLPAKRNPSTAKGVELWSFRVPRKATPTALGNNSLINFANCSSGRSATVTAVPATVPVSSLNVNVT